MLPHIQKSPRHRAFPRGYGLHRHLKLVNARFFGWSTNNWLVKHYIYIYIIFSDAQSPIQSHHFGGWEPQVFLMQQFAAAIGFVHHHCEPIPFGYPSARNTDLN